MTPNATAPRTNDLRRRAATGTGATLALVAMSVSTSGAAHAADGSTYTVRAGDTVSHIALRTGASVAAIASANALPDVSRIREGQVLTIPRASGTTAPQTSAPATSTTYTVRPGDTVSGIAMRTGSSIASIVAANGLGSDAMIVVGERLTIPTAGSTAPRTGTPTPTASTYTVRAGDTVSGIAARHGTTVSAIVSANHLGSDAMIRVGQTLRLSGSTAPSTPQPGTPLVGDTFEGRTYARDVVDAANANKRALLAAGVPSPSQMQAKVAATARAYGVDPRLAQAVAFQESGFNHTAVSPANAIGTMQVIPSAGDWASDLVGRELNLLDPDDNVTAGVVILQALLRISPDLPSAIAGYYQGASSVRKYGMFSDTRRYVANVQTLMGRF
ncbi:LysM peptidoglycan-binding domain-containing protein [Cellulomonas sp. DKR-3]|uniref:LysM peptidoglycan-binding domain-containing protein n=1 Tax=Cellulomonas fulva TaxID=2835530 RepID=A0ABS5U0E1_9CELL|nr:LysM peptidoglycan-binding domain-containing protein [Cellulomonas fulva]MBT0994877.1 LysM peptidoglycan-binding domain-containing protein [Cellulomonas fulva]